MLVREGSFVIRIYATPSRGYRSFSVVWRDPVKGRCREKISDFEAARTRALEIARSLANADFEGAAFTGPERARFHAIIEAARPTGMAPELAIAQFAQAHEILGGRSVLEAAREYARRHRLDLPQTRVDDAVEAFLEDRAMSQASLRYLADLRSRLQLNFARTHQCNLTDLTPEVLRRWLESQKGGPRTFNNNLTALRTFVAFCVGRHWLPRDGDLFDGIRKRKANGGAIEIWTPPEMASLLAGCPDCAVPAMAIGAFAGLRHAEIARLDWREINLSEGFIEVPALKAKTASRRLAPCPPNLVEWLKPRANAGGRVWAAHANRLHDAFREAASAAGLKWRDNALRHSFVSYRLAEIQDVARVALEAGNSPSMVFANYRKLVTPAQAAAWFRLTPDSKLG